MPPQVAGLFAAREPVPGSQLKADGREAPTQSLFPADDAACGALSAIAILLLLMWCLCDCREVEPCTRWKAQHALALRAAVRVGVLHSITISRRMGRWVREAWEDVCAAAGQDVDRNVADRSNTHTVARPRRVPRPRASS
eukprot:7071293-Prymnesium_polylepis.1